jgi:hypothetical protein
VTDSSYSCGIAIPYVTYFFNNFVYTPVYLRYVEWLGNPSFETQAWQLIQTHFKYGDINVSNYLVGKEKYVFQQILPDSEVNESAHTRRMLRKFKQSGFTLTEEQDVHAVLAIIQEELPRKVPAIHQGNLSILSNLVTSLNTEGMLLTILVRNHGKVLGGIFIVAFGNRLLYLKGAFTEDAKKRGAMYTAMHFAIQKAKTEGLVFDFGGSRVEGVRRFNKELGGADVPYARKTWNHLPLWQRTVINFVRSWRRK